MSEFRDRVIKDLIENKIIVPEIMIQQENEQLKARIARLECAILARAKRKFSETEKIQASKAWINALVAIANETPQQSLANIQADAREIEIKSFAYSLPFRGDILTRKEIERHLGKYIAAGNVKDAES